MIIAWFTGYIVRQRRRYAVRLQDEAASKAVTEERLRIARELHDVVAHSMSVIAVQAGYGQYVIDTQPADARDALGAIQATSREALDEMRRMLGALRQADQQDAAAQTGAQAGTPGRRAGDGEADGSAPLFPAPGLADLDRLLARTASAGVRVDVTLGGQPRDLPASIDLSAYRIVQEALTNVVKHARTSSCQVLIGYGRDELILEVTDNGAGLAELGGTGISHHRIGVTGAGPASGGHSARRKARAWLERGRRHPRHDRRRERPRRERLRRERARHHRNARAGHAARRRVQRGSAVRVRIPGNRPDPAARGQPVMTQPASAPAETGALRVVVADDQALVRVGFCGIIAATPGFAVVGEAGNGAEAVEAARRTAPDVILMDVRMPVMDGIEATRRITASTDVRVLILTTFDLDEYVFAALRAGASGFLLKDTLPADLLNAIRVVAAGDALLARASPGA